MVIEGWLGARGPCYPWCDRAEVCRRVVATAADLAFDEVPGVADLEAHWQKAHSRWCDLRGEVRAAAPCAVGRGRPQPAEQPTDRSGSIVSPKLSIAPPWSRSHGRHRVYSDGDTPARSPCEAR